MKRSRGRERPDRVVEQAQEWNRVASLVEIEQELQEAITEVRLGGGTTG